MGPAMNLREVSFPGRIITENVGGNTTYGRALVDGIKTRGIRAEVIPPGSNFLHNIARENWKLIGRGPQNGSLVHFVADTGALIRSSQPVVTTVHGVASRWVEGVRGPAQEAVWRARVGRAIKCSDAIVTPSYSSAADIAHVFDVDPGTLTVIPHGIEHVSIGQSRPGISDALLAQIPTSYLLYVGNIEPRKNLLSLIRALELPNAKELPSLVIAGKPAWGFTEVMAAIERSSRVTYVGFVSDSDRAALMLNCDAFVFPSQYEGFGFPVLEALALGVPVVSSRRGSLSEVAGPAYEIVEPSASGIAEALIAAMSDSVWSREIKAQGPVWASKFTWDRSVASHLEVYERVVSS